MNILFKQPCKDSDLCHMHVSCRRYSKKCFTYIYGFIWSRHGFLLLSDTYGDQRLSETYVIDLAIKNLQLSSEGS